MFYETSAKTGHGLDECVEGLVNKILSRYENLTDKNKINQNIKLKKDKNNKSKICYFGNLFK